MSKKRFTFIVVALLAVVAAIALLLPQQTERDQFDNEAALLPGLTERVNDVDRIEVIGAGGAALATLVRGEEAWGLDDFSGYPADIDVVREVLSGLAQATVIEPKTDNPDYYSRLGVEDVAEPEAAGTQVNLSAGEQQWSIIVGNEAPQRGGFYLRQPSVAGSVLADFDTDIPDDAKGWVDTNVVDIMAGEVAEVQVTHALDGAVLTVRKVSADETDFSLLELPEGRELKSAWSANSLGSGLSTLDFEAVAREEGPAWNQAIRIRLVRFDGLVIDAELVRLESGDFIKLRASAPFETAVDSEAATDNETEAAARAEVREAVESINERVSGWVYKIPAIKAAVFDKRIDDLIMDAEADPANS